MICALEDGVLSEGVANLLLLQDDVLLENLDGKQLACALLATKHHLAKGALAKHLEDLKVLQRNRLCGCNKKENKKERKKRT